MGVKDAVGVNVFVGVNVSVEVGVAVGIDARIADVDALKPDMVCEQIKTTLE